MSTASSVPHDVDVIVVGGGLSGLTVALGLERRGAIVEVLEAASRGGGVIGTRHHDGALYETGANSALDNTPLIRALIDELRLGDQRIEPNAAAAMRFVVRGGRLVALPSSPWTLMTTPAFSIGAKLRVLREPFIARSAPDVEESIATFVRRRLGREMLDYAVDPFVSGVYAGDPEQISVAAAFPRLLALERQHGGLLRGRIAAARAARQSGAKRAGRAGSFSFRNGMQVLTDALVHRVGRVTTGARIEHIERNPDGGWSISGHRDGEPIARRAKAVVLSTPAPEAATLVRELAPAAAQALDAIAYAPIAIVVTAYRKREVAHPLAGFGFLVPRREERGILGTLFSSSMFEGRAPTTVALLTTFVGGRRNPQALLQTDDELASLVQGELRALVGATGEPLWTECVRWQRAIPQYDIGHLQHLRRVEDAERALPGLGFCANYRGGVSVGDCIASAHAHVQRVMRFLAGDTPRSS